MATISANTKHKMAVPGGAGKKKTTTIGIGGTTKKIGTKKAGGGSSARRGSVAPTLQPATLTTQDKIDAFLSKENRQQNVVELYKRAMGEQPTLVDKSRPHVASSTTRDRAGAAADVAVVAQQLGIRYVMKDCGLMDELQRMLFPDGISKTFATNLAEENEMSDDGGGKNTGTGGGSLKPSISAVSLTSLDTNETVTSVDSITVGTDSKRGKTTPATAREGSLLLIRAFCERLGKKAEPYVVGAFLAAALDECGSNSSSVREAAEDTATALVQLANPWAFPRLICPLLLQALRSTEWRVKANALDILEKCAKSSSAMMKQVVCQLLPTLIPAVTSQVWDTKAQVNKAAGSCLLAVCQTCTNKDVLPAIPAVAAAVCKPSETNKAVSELMSTTFVVTVDAPTLAILCPVLSRALKEKLAIHKRAACIVINNMSKLVGSPEDVAPFGHLLVPELKKVASSVQFEEIRDEALKALASLTKALGDAYTATSSSNDGPNDATNNATAADQMAAEQAKVEAEQKKIEDERAALKQKEEEQRLKEEEEKKRFKEAMDAQRELNRLEAEKIKQQKEADKKAKEAAKLSTKGGTGKCQMCGLKKCKKTCTFYSGP